MQNNIKYLRRAKEYDISQKELAVRIGISTKALSNIEKGGGANIQTAFKLAKFFDKKIEDIFFE